MTENNLLSFDDLKAVATHLREKLDNDDKKYQLLFAHNGIGKTRLSMAFKEEGKRLEGREGISGGDTLYFNAFTEDLFTWDNDTQRALKLNSDSCFFAEMS